jgi:hypothetical protein
MIRKPWPIVILSIIFFAIPIFNIIGTYYMLDANITFSEYFMSLILEPENYISLTNMIVPSLLSGFAIYSIKKWSLPVCIASTLWVGYQLLSEHHDALKSSSLFFIIVFPLFTNLAFVAYFLIPNVRAAYIDPSLRWWENKPRYIVNFECEVTFEKNTFIGTVEDLSEGGLFLNLNTPFKINDIALIKFNFLDHDFISAAKFVFQKPNSNAFGVQFVQPPKISIISIKEITRIMAKENYKLRRETPDWKEDLTDWAKTLFKTGKGIVPEVPKKK